MHTSDELDTSITERQHLSRRSVLKAGAHAAWVVPAVQVVGAAPAFASCSATTANPVTFTVDQPTWVYKSEGGSNNWVLDLVFHVCDSNCAKALAGLTISITSTTIDHLNDHSTSADWAQSRSKTKGGSNQQNKTYTSNYTVPAGGCHLPFTISIQAQDGKKYADTFSITVSSQYSGTTQVFTTPGSVSVTA